MRSLDCMNHREWLRLRVSFMRRSTKACPKSNVFHYPFIEISFFFFSIKLKPWLYNCNSCKWWSLHQIYLEGVFWRAKLHFTGRAISLRYSSYSMARFWSAAHGILKRLQPVGLLTVGISWRIFRGSQSCSERLPTLTFRPWGNAALYIFNKRLGKSERSCRNHHWYTLGQSTNNHFCY